VSWLFTRKGSILVPRGTAPDEVAIMEIALDAGADDLDTSDADYYSIATAPEDLHRVKEALEQRGIEVESAEFSMEPSATARLEGKPAMQMLRLMEAFDDHDDVQHVWANFDIDDDMMANL